MTAVLAGKTVVQFAAERLTHDLWAEAWPLLKQHWHEIAHFKDIPLEPDLAKYDAAHANGAVRVFTARADGTLVGYALFFVGPNPHYRSSVQAVEDVLYVDPAHRGFMPIRFVRFIVRALSTESEVVYMHLKAAKDWGKILHRMGFEHVDQIYALRTQVRDDGEDGG